MIFDTLNICIKDVNEKEQWFTYSFEELRTVLRKHGKIVYNKDQPITNADIFKYVETFRANLVDTQLPLVILTATKMMVFNKQQIVSVEMFIEGGEYEL